MSVRRFEPLLETSISPCPTFTAPTTPLAALVSKISLDNLGDNADLVADSLKKMGIHGVRNTFGMQNPIVRFARAQAAEQVDMKVLACQTLRLWHPVGKTQDIQLPRPVVAFLGAFNEGMYPELESNVR
ncbi:MAG TPA: hypothetical protein VE988_28330 [Gemmataceae bacterium]|nr:hypothetical protein [Gemmataceae bacterium]